MEEVSQKSPWSLGSIQAAPSPVRKLEVRAHPAAVQYADRLDPFQGQIGRWAYWLHSLY